MGEPQGRALSGQTVGVIGIGGIGRALIQRLRPFGVRLMGIKRYDPESAKNELNLEWVGGPGELKMQISFSPRSPWPPLGTF